MTSVDFNDLPEITKNRFVAASRDRGGVIAFFPTMADSALGWGCMLFVGGGPLIFALIAALNPTNRARSNDFAPTAFGMVAILTAAATLAILGLMSRRKMRLGHPFARGTYVFSTRIVVAESKMLQLHQLSELIHVETVHRYVNGGYQGSWMTATFTNGPAVVFRAPSIQEANRVSTALSQGKQTLIGVLQLQQYEALRPVDPFFEAQMASFAKVREGGPIIADMPKWTGIGTRFLISAGAAFAFTAVVVVLRIIVLAIAGDDPPPTPSKPVATTPTATTPPAAPTTPKKKPGGR